uniref:Uncharacterized protein n=1 Tax=Romanomermis culicivorax TaxID=13658 RepID=A0A915I463_ROMCU
MSATKSPKFDLSIGLFSANPSVSFIEKNYYPSHMGSEDRKETTFPRALKERTDVISDPSKRPKLESYNHSNMEESVFDNRTNLNVSNSLLMNALEGRYSKKRCRLRTTLDDLLDDDASPRRKKIKYHKSLLSMMGKEPKSPQSLLVVPSSCKRKTLEDAEEEYLKRRPLYSSQKIIYLDSSEKVLSRKDTLVTNNKNQQMNVEERSRTDLPPISNHVAKIIPLDQLNSVDAAKLFSPKNGSHEKSNSNRRLLFAKSLHKNPNSITRADPGVNHAEINFKEEQRFQRNFIQSWLIDQVGQNITRPPPIVTPKLEPPALLQYHEQATCNRYRKSDSKCTADVRCCQFSARTRPPVIDIANQTQNVLPMFAVASSLPGHVIKLKKVEVASLMLQNESRLSDPSLCYKKKLEPLHSYYLSDDLADPPSSECALDKPAKIVLFSIQKMDVDN